MYANATISFFYHYFQTPSKSVMSLILHQARQDGRKGPKPKRKQAPRGPRTNNLCASGFGRTDIFVAHQTLNFSAPDPHKILDITGRAHFDFPVNSWL